VIRLDVAINVDEGSDDRPEAGRRRPLPAAGLHADWALKEQALARTTPPGTAPGRYRPPDKLLAFLEAL
jgi:hypothetical protein